MKEAVMKCKEVCELMPDLAAGLSTATAEMNDHIHACPECTEALIELRQTMALLDEWEAPEPSAFFDTRLRARLREEAAKQPSGWVAWLRKPVLAVSLAALMVLGITFFRGDGKRHGGSEPMATVPGSAVGDLQALDKNHDLYSDFDVLDDLEVQSNVTANP